MTGMIEKQGITRFSGKDAPGLFDWAERRAQLAG
jgi:hypothetical protein